jgi:anti-sigma-K factor RskA
MTSTHDEMALAAPYVLGALEPDERRVFEAHVATCRVCTDEVRSLNRVAEALARSVPARTPPAELRARVLDAIGTASRAARPPGHGRRSPRAVPGWLPLAATVVVCLGLGAYAWLLQQRVATLEARLDGAERRALAAERDTIDARRAADQAEIKLAVVTAPDLVRIDLAGQPPAARASGRALWSRGRGMVLTTANLPAAPAGRVYQVWVVTAAAAVSAGLLTPDPAGAATVFFETPRDIPAPVAVAVTLEPAGGVPAPTGDKYLVGTPL